MISFLRTRILFSLALGLFVLTASALAEVTYDSAAGTFIGDGTYSEAVDATGNLTATPTTGQTITFTNNIVSTGAFTQSGAYVVFDTGTVNSFNALYINNVLNINNNARMTLNGSMSLTELHMANSGTTYFDITNGASLSVSGKVYINETTNAQGIITQTGGTVSFTTSGSDDVRIGHWPNSTWPSRYDISGGSLSIPNTTTYVGWDGYAEMNISGGEVSLKCLSLSNGQNRGKGTLRLTGGTLNIGDGGIVRNKRNVSGPLAAEVYLGQGTINATANQTWGSDLTLSLTGRSATNTADVAGGVTTFNADSGKTITIPSVISGVGALTKTGAGTLTLSGANTYTGGTTISAGTLELTGAGTLGTGAVTNNATLKFNYNADKTLSNAISGTGTIVKEGTNTVKLDGAFSSTGNMAINGGKVSVLMDGTNKKFNVKNLSGSGELELRLASGNSDTQMTSLVNDNFTGVISLVQEGAASSNKVYTNTQTFEGFNLKVNNGTSIFIAGSEFKGNVQITGNGNNENRGALRIANSVSGNITVAADANIAFEGNNTVSGAIDSGASSGEVTLFINGKTDGTTATVNRDAGTLRGAISDGTSGSKLGLRIVSNTMTFTGALSYTGATTINAGATMNLSGANANLVNSRAVEVNGKLDFSNYTGSNAMQLNDLSGTTAAAEIDGTNKNLILNNNNDTSYAGVVRTLEGNVTKTGSGKLTLSGKIASSGVTTVSAGTLNLTESNIVSTSDSIVNNAAITASADQTFHNLSGSGDIAFSNNSNLTLTGSPQSAYSGNIAGMNTLTVQHNSAYDLSGATVSVANFETKEGASVSVSSEKPITVTESFRQGNDAKFTFSGGNASISGANVAQQATIALNGGTMSISSYDSTAPELPNYSGLALHLDASNASSFDDSSSISTWYNLADSNNNLTFTGYGGSTSHAYVTPAGQNGLDVMTFPTNGTAYYDMASAINGQTFFAVMADNGYTSSSQHSFLFGNKDGNYYFHRGTGTTMWESHAHDNIENGRNLVNGNVVTNSSSIGTGWDVFSIQATGPVSLSAISRERSNLTIARGWRGDIAEILVYTEKLSDEQVLEVTKYLATKWQVGPNVVEPTIVTTGDFVSTNAINVVADSTIDVAGFSSVTFDSTSIDEGKTLTINVAENQTTWTSPISGEGSLTKSGNGTLTLTEEPAYTGATTVEAGTLALTEGGTLYNLSGGSLNPDGTIAQSAALDATGKDLTLVNSETTKFIGSITAKAIEKTGDGTLQIYTGAEGQVDAQSMTVSFGRLDLKGYLTGGITVDAGSVFSPGNSVGEAVIGGAYILKADATLLIEQDATGMDTLTASSFEIDPNAILELTVGAAIPGATYDIIFQKNGDSAVNFTGDYATDDFWNSLLTPQSAYYWNLSVKDGYIVSAKLDPNAVPEPAAWMLMVLGVVVLFLRKRVKSEE